MSDSEHVPVLLAECLTLLDPRPGGRFIDCTVDGGGHSAAILERTAPDGPLLALDADPDAVVRAKQRLAGYRDRVRVVHANFRRVAQVADQEGFGEVDGLLMDLGLSSLQIGGSGRGFSFNRDETLDMRYDRSSGQSAADFIASVSREELESVIRTLGEEPRARAIASEVVASRERAPVRTTGQLAAIVSRATGGRRGRLHPATRTFQALRILVNDELGALAEGLPQAVGLLRRGGRLAVISFHSLEDRIVKRFFRRQTGEESDESPRGLPTPTVRPSPPIRILTRRPILGSDEQLARVGRGRSARLRAVERL